MKNSKSLLWTFIKSTVVNCLIVIAFSGLFNGSLRIDKPIYGFYGALLLTILYMFIIDGKYSSNYYDFWYFYSYN